MAILTSSLLYTHLTLWLVLVFFFAVHISEVHNARMPSVIVQEDLNGLGENCTHKCSCYFSKARLKVDCRNRDLFSISSDSIPPSTVDLQLSNNHLTSIDFQLQHKLESLYVSNNSISQLSTHSFSNLKNLQILDLSFNKLNSKGLNWFFANLSQLVVLNMSSNEITNISQYTFYGLKSLRYLNLSSNLIQRIEEDSFLHLNFLITLDISENNLTRLKHEWFQNLKNLSNLILKRNKLATLSNVVFWPLNNLAQLDLSCNSISSIGLLSFKGLNSVHYLNISSNNITLIQEGTLRPLQKLEILDLSHNPIISLDRVFTSLSNLKTLLLINLYQFKTLTHTSLTGLSKLTTLYLRNSPLLSFIEPRAFSNTKILKNLDLRENNLTTLPTGLFSVLENMEILFLQGNPWKCDCYMYWLLTWLGDHTQTHLLAPSDTICSQPASLEGHVLLDALDHGMLCVNASIKHYSLQAHFKMGSTALLQCQAEGSPFPTVTWITPQRLVFHWQSIFNASDPAENVTFLSGNHPIIHTRDMHLPLQTDIERYLLLKNGNLLIRGVDREDTGFYHCIASNPLNNQSVSMRLTLDYEYLTHIKIVSILVGMATSFGFLLITLITVFIQLVMYRCGVKCRCPCSKGSHSPKTQQIKRILESMEHYKRQQLDRLRENYNFQVQRIKDNCMQQMEKLRESYSGQIERLRDIRDYGTQQIDRIRENYYLQVQKVRDYSCSQIERLRENYLFQRNRIRKFSTHQLYKLRENYKLQQQHLNKILENLNLESCRNVCARTDSIIFEPEISVEPVFVPKMCPLVHSPLDRVPSDSVDNSSQLSAYFTPDNASEISGHDSLEFDQSTSNNNELDETENLTDNSVMEELTMHIIEAGEKSSATDIPEYNSVEEHEILENKSIAELDSNETVV